MYKNKNTKGFTLIELLIVILIIGILAVAFLPTIFGAPAKARDTARLADINRIRNVIIGEYVANSVAFPTATACITASTPAGMASYLPSLGGSVPTDPGAALISIPANAPAPAATCAAGEYLFLAGLHVPTGYDFAIVSHVEDADKGNVVCTLAGVLGTTIAVVDSIKSDPPAATDTNCYAVLYSNS